jgi:hypothetical protein
VVSRNHEVVDSSGVPMCFGEHSNSSNACDNCPMQIKERCLEEKSDEDGREPDVVDNFLGKPLCFGKYGEYSTKCNKLCDFARDCEVKGKGTSLHLPIVQNTGSSGIKNVYETKPTTPFNFYTPPKTSVPSTSSAYFNIPTSNKKPDLSSEQCEELYGRKFHPNPIIDGQFEGEPWYSRLLKEFVLKTTQHGVSVMGSLLIDMLGRIRWAPDED